MPRATTLPSSGFLRFWRRAFVRFSYDLFQTRPSPTI
jgi:hypothetical protein